MIVSAASEIKEDINNIGKELEIPDLLYILIFFVSHDRTCT
jgi:hypothetical protein